VLDELDTKILNKRRLVQNTDNQEIIVHPLPLQNISWSYLCYRSHNYKVLYPRQILGRIYPHLVNQG